jgi:hypothetical protein
MAEVKIHWSSIEKYLHQFLLMRPFWRSNQSRTVVLAASINHPDL